MSEQTRPVEVFLEVGKQRIFAGAIDWPGWCRSGRDEAAALEALLAAGPRYAMVLRAAQIAFQAPDDVAGLAVRERVPGSSTTDFGAPEAALAADDRPVDAAELKRLQNVLKACWAALDRAAANAEGRELRKGPRGGGRDLTGVLAHVLGAEQGYLRSLGWRTEAKTKAAAQDVDAFRQVVLDALAAAVRGELPAEGPRGGKHWKPRTFVRRVAWHTLDHVWELEDRLV